MQTLQTFWIFNKDSFLIFGVAAIVGLLTGLQRVFLQRRASIRIHVFVATGAAMFVHVPAKLIPNVNVASLIQGVATGIGFIGAGAILQKPAQNEISGISVAGTIWLTAALGMSAGLGLVVLPLLAAAVALGFVKLTR